MNISDLNISEELDSAALAGLAGGSIVARRYLGSSTQNGSWSYHGERALRFLGNVYVHGRGWTKKFLTVKCWSRKQYFKQYFNVYVA